MGIDVFLFASRHLIVVCTQTYIFRCCNCIEAVVSRLYEMLYPCIGNVVISCWKSGAYDFVICRGGTDMCFVPRSGWKRLDLEQYRISGLTYMQALDRLGHSLTPESAIDTILGSLPPRHNSFITNFHMHGMAKKPTKLHGMLKIAEQDIKKGTHQVLMVQNTAKFKKSWTKKKANAKGKDKDVIPTPAPAPKP